MNNGGSLTRRITSSISSWTGVGKVNNDIETSAVDSNNKSDDRDKNVNTVLKVIVGFIFCLIVYSLFKSTDKVGFVAVPLAKYPHMQFLANKYDPKIGEYWHDDPTLSCGPWLCAYFDNPTFEGEPFKVAKKTELVTNWQETMEWSFDGVPELHHSRHDFSVRCVALKYLTKGSYTFIGKVVGADGYFGSVVGGKTKMDLTTPGWELPPKMYHLNVKEAQYTEIMFELSHASHDARIFAVLSWVKNHKNTVTTQSGLQTAEKAACLISPHCHSELDPPVCPLDRKLQGHFWGLCKPWLSHLATFNFQPVSNQCIIFAVGLTDPNLEMARGYMEQGCKVHIFDCNARPSTEIPQVHFHDWCIGGNWQNSKSIVKTMDTLGYTDRAITVLKFDCDGCEWTALHAYATESPDQFEDTLLIYASLTFFSDDILLSTQAKVSDQLKKFRIFRHHMYPDVSKQRGNVVDSAKVYRVGVLSHAYHIAWVNQRVLDSFPDEPEIEVTTSNSTTGTGNYTSTTVKEKVTDTTN